MADKDNVTGQWQVGIIVKDIQKAMEGMAKIGIGPFASLNAEPTVKWEEKGKPIEVKLKMKFASIGPLEIELIEPISECMQKEFLDKKGEGIQHISYFVKDIDKEVKRLTGSGYKVVQRGWRPTSGGYAFFDTQESLGFMLEIIQR
jgi:methylmalonyl-CoA/ethylmalonyl-CoA epimerase